MGADSTSRGLRRRSLARWRRREGRAAAGMTALAKVLALCAGAGGTAPASLRVPVPARRCGANSREAGEDRATRRRFASRS
jgi:hypothetical protein